MTSMPNPSLKTHIFKRTEYSFPYFSNFAVDWVVKDVFLSYKKLNGFPLNPLNENFTIMQSKNG